MQNENNDKNKSPVSVEEMQANTLTNGIRGLIEIHKCASDASPWPSRIYIAFQAGLLFIGLAISVLYFEKQPMWVTISFIIIVLPCFLILLRINKLDKFNVIWQNSYIDNQSNKDKFSEIGNLLETLQNKVHEILNLDVDLIRTSIFIPDVSNVPEGFTYLLHMPHSLSRNINDPNEFDVRFKNGEGAAGRCFLKGETIFTDNKEFALGDSNKNIISKDIKWILSFPIKFRKTGHTIAVLNIDGLQKQIDNKQVDEIKNGVNDQVNKIEKKIGLLKMKTIVLHNFKT